APELTIPEPATITVGEAFDPMVGVSATDNTDGDLTDAVQVIGAIDTDTPGTYVLTYVVEDSNGNQASATRAITVTEATNAGNQDDADNSADTNTEGQGAQTGGRSDDSEHGGDAGSQVGGTTDTTDVDPLDQRNGNLADTGAERTPGTRSRWPAQPRCRHHRLVGLPSEQVDRLSSLS